MNRGPDDRHLQRQLPRLRAQPHRRAVPLPLQGPDLHGYARADVLTDKGCAKLGVDNLKNGVVTRGMLIDIPRLKNLP